jgi:uncharacterized protein (TIGR01777 family)
MTALITGGTGLLGRKLLTKLPGATVLSRAPERASRALPSVTMHGWEPEAGPVPARALRGIDVVFNLAGDPVARGRWTTAKKRRIRDSRVVGTRNLVAALAAADVRPQVLVSASAVGIYGDQGDRECTEESPSGTGFLADVCTQWEREALAAEALGIRVVCARIGIVLARGGGALAQMLLPFRLGVGGRLGSGKQWMPWVHVSDVVGLLLHAARTASIRGPLNVVAPAPVTNADFTRELARVLRRPALLPVPGTALRIAFGEMSEILMASQRVLPRAAERSGYAFLHRQLPGALEAVLSASGGETVA